MSVITHLLEVATLFSLVFAVMLFATAGNDMCGLFGSVNQIIKT